MGGSIANVPLIVLVFCAFFEVSCQRARFGWGLYTCANTVDCIAGVERQVVDAKAVTSLLQATRNVVHALGHVHEDETVEQMQRMLEVEGMSMIQVPPF